MFMDIAGSVLVFKIVHGDRGRPEAIAFLDGWYKQIASLVFTYCSMIKDSAKIERLYFLLVKSSSLDEACLNEFRDNICRDFPDIRDALNAIENEVAISDDYDDFLDISTEKQKEYFSSVSKDLGMDPDDPENEYGRIVAIGLENYDPTEIIKNCEHLFVHYRPSGVIAQSLRMHSAGGMHLLVCLKHGYAQGTGNLLFMLYDNQGGFKQSHCEGCEDCAQRDSTWSWSLDWYDNEVADNKEFLEKYKV